MSRFTGGDIGIEFAVNVEKPQYHYVSGAPRKKKRGGGKGWGGYTTSGGYREETGYGIDRKLNEASRTIADLVKTHLEEYAPVDESDYADDVVMKNHVVMVGIKGEYEVGFENIPYATRRNYEHTEHYNKEGKNLNFVEDAWNNHIREYEEILDEAAENGADELLMAYLNRSSGATTGYNWGEETQGLHFKNINGNG